MQFQIAVKQKWRRQRRQSMMYENGLLILDMVVRPGYVVGVTSEQRPEYRFLQAMMEVWIL